jgi:hypothetical protein
MSEREASLSTGRELPQPAPELTFDVSGSPSETIQSDRIDVDSMKVRKPVGDLDRQLLNRSSIEQRARARGVAEYMPLDEIHDIERRTDYRVAHLIPDKRWDGHRSITERLHYPELTPDVVRSRQDRVQRRPAKHPPASRCIAHQIGEVRSPPGDHREVKRRRDHGGTTHPPGQRNRVDADDGFGAVLV